MSLLVFFLHLKAMKLSRENYRLLYLKYDVQRFWLELIFRGNPVYMLFWTSAIWNHKGCVKGYSPNQRLCSEILIKTQEFSFFGGDHKNYWKNKYLYAHHSSFHIPFQRSTNHKFWSVLSNTKLTSINIVTNSHI